MKIFLATAKLDDIRVGAAHGMLDGVLTTPSLLTAQVHPAGANELLAEICRLATFPVAVTVGAVNAERHLPRRARAREAVRLDDRADPVRRGRDRARCKRLRAEGVRVAATLVFNTAQAILAAKAGAGTVCVHVDQLDAQGQDGVEHDRRDPSGVRDARRGVRRDGGAAAERRAVRACALAGADAIAVSADVLRALLLHPLTDRGLDQFLTDLSRTHRTRVK